VGIACTRVRGLSPRGLVLGGKSSQLGQGEDRAVAADVAAADVVIAGGVESTSTAYCGVCSSCYAKL